MNQPTADQFIYADKESNKNENEAAYFLVLSGGAFRGAFQVWVVVHLMATYCFGHISGVSVGAINGVLAAMQKLHTMLEFWHEIDNKRGYLRLRGFYLLGLATGIVWILNKLGAKILPGLYSMAPLVKKLEEYVKLQDIKTPYACGLVAAQGGKELYYQVDHIEMKSDQDAVTAIQASSCMVPFMKPPLYDIPDTAAKEPEIAIDGGYWNIFPIPWTQIEQARKDGKRIVIHAVGCTPLQRVKRVSSKQITGMIPIIFQAIQIMEAAIYDGDILQLRLAAGFEGEVNLWVPDIDPGDPFDASSSTIQARLEEGKKMVERGPITFSGIGTTEELTAWRKAMMSI